MLNRKQMDEKEKLIRHLEMIQGVINRLGHDSFLIKGWSTAILAAGVIFIARNEIQNGYFLLLFLIIVIGFWVLDGFYLRQERLFRELYCDISKQEKTNFSMCTKQYENQPKCKCIKCVCSKTLLLFYLIEMAFILGVFLTMYCGVES